MDKIISAEFSRLIEFITTKYAPKGAEEESLKKFIKLILVLARRYVRANVEYEDVIMQGIIGLIEGVRGFDPARSDKFNSYILTRIRGRMYEYCIGNTSQIYVPTHVSKARAYVEKMTKMVDQDPYIFRSEIDPRSVIHVWEHPAEEYIEERTEEEIKRIKGMLKKIAINSRTTYEELVILAYRSMVIETYSCDYIENSHNYTSEAIESSAEARETVEKLDDALGAKKSSVVVLHSQGYTNEDIAGIIHKEELTPRRYSRQAVRGLLKSAESSVETMVDGVELNKLTKEKK
jgi:RNA polymerase sigma factor (sigma-70 family)